MNNKKEKQENNSSEKDYSKYSYKEEANVVISGRTFNLSNNLLHLLLKDETKVFFQTDENGNETPPIFFKTDKGKAIDDMIAVLWSEHIKNVDNGVATPLELLQEDNRPIITK